MKEKKEKLFKSEAEFSKHVIKLAHDYGWKVARFHRLPTAHGSRETPQWRTPVGADGKGYPDLTLVRERLLFAELKLRPNKPDVNQQNWQDWLTSAGCEAYVWNDGMLDEIERVLRLAVLPKEYARLLLACDGDLSQARDITRMVKAV